MNIDQIVNGISELNESDLARARPENAKMREALEEISGGQIQCADGSARDMTAFRMKLIARAAIEAMKGD